MNDKQSGQIFKIHSDFYYILDNKKQIIELKSRENLKKQGSKILVGDFVEYKNGFIDKILPRKNFITRPNVANIDQVVIVTAIKEPMLDFEQLDRYIAIAKYHNLETKLCFNKNDLSEDDTIIEKIFEIYEPLGFDIVFTSAIKNFGIENLSEILKGKTTVFCGNSGVGKSSLINAINPNLKLRTKAVSEKTERGTHTTRHSEIINLNDFNIVDTPGFSNVRFDFLMPNKVDLLFPEISQYKDGCKFSDCLHETESECNVIKNIEKISTSRYESYLAFVKEAKEYKEKIKYQGNKAELSHKSINDKTITKISSRKRIAARNTLKQNIYKDTNYEDE